MVDLSHLNKANGMGDTVSTIISIFSINSLLVHPATILQEQLMRRGSKQVAQVLFAMDKSTSSLNHMGES
jgi:hypothetical protein